MKTLIDLYTYQVINSPMKTAIYSDKGNLNFSEIYKKSTSIANSLIQNSAIENGYIGLYVEPSLEMAIGTFGIIQAGCAYLPLAPEYPEERISFMIKDSQLRIILTQKHLVEKLKAFDLHDILLIVIEDIQENTNEIKLNENFNESSLAYMIYTSGTTGTPKGVEIEHRSIVNQLNWLKVEFHLADEQIILRKTPMSFDAAQWEILSVLIGASIVIGAPGIYRDPQALIDTIIENKITAIQCVPTLLQALTVQNNFASCTTLKYIFSGGEALSRRLAKVTLELLPSSKLVNLYGPTECTINSSSLIVDKQYLEKAPKTISIGHPILNTSYQIIDVETNQIIQDVGKVGELYIGGVQLARGYLNKPEQTSEKFIDYVTENSMVPIRLYKTGDLVYWNEDKNVDFIGRVDNQIKLHGYRIELDEIRLAIENHNWVKNAAVFIDKDEISKQESLIACVSLNPSEAMLMDQGNHGHHHLTKSTRTQVKAQLSDNGIRDTSSKDFQFKIELPNKKSNDDQINTAFSRKTYRFFEGEAINEQKIIELLEWQVKSDQQRKIKDLNISLLGNILRYLGPFYSEERLLPKYSYASPGALYAHQLYLEIEGIDGIRDGIYYFNQISHELILIKDLSKNNIPRCVFHFVGKKTTIETVYKNNVLEVLEMEAGHVLGVLDIILPKFGFQIGDGAYKAELKSKLLLDDEHEYLGSFPLESFKDFYKDSNLKFYIQSHDILDLTKGFYSYSNKKLKKITDNVIQKKHVIAINQRTYENSNFGIALVNDSPNDWKSYIRLGRMLQILQMNDLNIGFMSSGYSSKTGNDLSTAKKLIEILNPFGLGHKSSYFALGGGISSEQILHHGMKEDSIHLKGPAEIIKDDLEKLLPKYMVPNKIVMVDELPLSPNGKVNINYLKDTIKLNKQKKEIVQPRNKLESDVKSIWKKIMKLEEVCIQDDFFELGGDSLLAVTMIHEINQNLHSRLPLQSIFTNTSIQSLSNLIDTSDLDSSNRFLNLNGGKYYKQPIFCWPGLGGYPMNLRGLAQAIGNTRPFYGVQAYGINEDERPYKSLSEMAIKDLEVIRKIQPNGPYTLWGYSFGAKVAFEVAYQLESMGEVVDNIILIAPGSPSIRKTTSKKNGRYHYDDIAFMNILYSVFSAKLPTSELDEVFEKINSKKEFIEFISEKFRGLDLNLLTRIAEIVEITYDFNFSISEILEHNLKAPITVLKAVGDNESFIEKNYQYLNNKPKINKLSVDHYNILKDSGVDELLEVINHPISKDYIVY